VRVYYFDIRDGVPLRDRHGLEFATLAEAIRHSKDLAQRIRSDQRAGVGDRYIAVIDESGTELHREPVHYPTA